MPSQLGPPSAGSGPAIGGDRRRRRRARWPDFPFGEATRSLYDAIWNEFCDWGLELAKIAARRRDALAGDARGDLVDPGRGARYATFAFSIP